MLGQGPVCGCLHDLRSAGEQAPTPDRELPALPPPPDRDGVVTNPAGWYDDPHGGTPGQLRYWNGQQWTEFTVVPPQSPVFPAYGSGPSGPAPGHAPEATDVGPGREDFAPGRLWRLRHSLWVLAPILGFGYLSFVGFAYCAARVRTPAWIVAAICSTVLTVVGYILVAVWTDASGAPTTAAIVYNIDLWLASIIFAIVVNRDYLAWRARHA